MRPVLRVTLAFAFLCAGAIVRTSQGDPAADEMKKLEGTWILSSMENGAGKNELAPKEVPKIIIAAGELKYFDGKTLLNAWPIKVDPSKTPPWIDMGGKDGPMMGVYKLDGDELRMCTTVGKNRPTAVAVAKDCELLTMKRATGNEAIAPAGKTPVAASAVAAQTPDNIPFQPLEKSGLVVKDAAGAPIVADKEGKGIDGIKLSQHDRLIGSPSIAVAPDGTIHVAFIEQHRTTFANAVYHRCSSDGGKTWTEAKNLSEDMVGVDVDRCQVLADAHNRAYAIWQTPLGGIAGRSALWFRELEAAKWSKTQPISALSPSENPQDNSARCFFGAVDATGRAQVIWNVEPDRWHPELTLNHTHVAGVGDGLVFQCSLDGNTTGKPREVFLPAVSPTDTRPWPDGHGPACDGLDMLNGYFDAGGAAHFVAATTGMMHGKNPHPPDYELMENGKAGQAVKLPPLLPNPVTDVPTLLIDAKGKRHLIALYLAGEHPNVRDYLLGSEDEPTVIRAAVGLNGTIAGVQAFQGPGGRMVAIMQVYDNGDRHGGENYISLSTGDGKWTTPVNVTNNAGRKTFQNAQTSARTNVGVITSCVPGLGAAAFDREGHLLLVMVTGEYKIAIATAAGVNIAGGDVIIPALRFLRF